MWLSTTAHLTFVSAMGTQLVSSFFFLVPRRQRFAARRRAKEILRLIHATVKVCDSPLFDAIMSLSLVNIISVPLLIPPDMVNTKGVNDPCSALMIR